jgi:hypothetical protein
MQFGQRVNRIDFDAHALQNVLRKLKIIVDAYLKHLEKSHMLKQRKNIL